MNPVILFREELTLKGELCTAEKYFQIFHQRASLPKDSLVIPRYSALPYYKELEEDVRILGSKLINTYDQHRWVANFDYYEELKEYTPESWDDTNFYQCQHSGPFVVKGRTNSSKHQWNRKMFAKTKREALDIASELMTDSWLGQQGIIYRKFIPLKVFEVGLNDLPFSNEWRFFFYRNTCLSYGYYWTNAKKVDHELAKEGFDLALHLANIVSKRINFFVLDIAETEKGDWILIEVNDGTMSGLSENDPDELYKNLKKSTETPKC